MVWGGNPPKPRPRPWARVFTWSDPRRIARSLLRSARQSTRRKSSPGCSAMSMLSFYI